MESTFPEMGFSHSFTEPREYEKSSDSVGKGKRGIGLSDADFKLLFAFPKVPLTFIKLLLPTPSGLRLQEHFVSDLDVSTIPLHELSDRILHSLERVSEESTSEYGKKIIYDVLLKYSYDDPLTGERENAYIVNFEMQKSNESSRYNPLARMNYYVARTFSNMLYYGNLDYRKLRKCYSIWFLGYREFDDDVPIHSIAQRVVYNTKGTSSATTPSYKQEVDYFEDADFLEIVVVELPKLDFVTDNNLYVALNSLCTRPTKTELHNVFGLEREEAVIMEKQRTVLEAYLEDELAEIKDDIEAKGIAKGRAEGRAEGRVEGREEGRAEGKAEAREEVERTIVTSVRAMLRFGAALSEVAKEMNKPVEELQRLLEKYS